MIDALLYAVRDVVRDGGLGYDYKTCEIVGPDGAPPARCGDVFLGVHGSPASESTMQNALNELFSFQLTLSMRCSNVPPDRVGDRLLATTLAQEKGFNRRCRAVLTLLHMNWYVLHLANTYLLEWAPPEATQVYGFCEPARFAGVEDAQWADGVWYSGNPESSDVGLKATMRFEKCRRLQAIAVYS